MREFILFTHKAVTSDFRLNDLPGAGRMDLVCRCISNALFISEAIRKDTIIHIVLNGPPSPPKTISFFGETVRNLYPDERTIASHIKIALRKSFGLKANEEMESTPGVKISKKSFESLLKEKVGKTQLIYLNPKGKDIRDFEFKKDVAIIIGDHKGIPKKVEIFMERIGCEKVSLGKIEYLASACISIIHNELDRRFE
jgi:tRNA (pseudouridine54-N1)-methyltransferase